MENGKWNYAGFLRNPSPSPWAIAIMQDFCVIRHPSV